MVGAATHKSSFWRKPQRVWLRRALFQVHLWAGLLLCVYLVLVGVSGSVLVFEQELADLTYPQWMKTTGPSEGAADGSAIERVGNRVAAAYPGWTLGTVYAPGVRGENYAVLLSRAGRYQYVFASSQDGRVLGGQLLDQGWLNWVADLHFRLLGGPVGFAVNGIGAACLVLLCVTGLVIWWPGIQKWRRALTIDWRRSWKRVIFDLHSAVGFWTLAWVSIWAVSGVYFVWPFPFVAALGFVSKAPHAVAPVLHVENGKQAKPLAVATLVTRALATDPAARLQGVTYPAGDSPFTVLVTRDPVDQFSNSTYVYLHPVTGARMGVWHAGARETVGDWVIWLMGPLHFGTAWGLSGKVLWAVLGLSLPLLSVTGVLLYWNRYLGQRWRKLRQADAIEPALAHTVHQS